MNLFHEAKKVLDKDGKVNALGPYGKSKLTGREVSQYFRKNKVSDPEVKKAVEVALDLGGAYDVARKEIEKFYGSKILKSKEVQKALKFANEEVVNEENLQEISLDTNMLQRQFPNVWATKDSKLYRVLNSLISFHGYNDNVKAYKKNPKAFIDSLKKIAANPGKHKELGRDFKQYIEKPKKGQSFAEGTMAIGIFDSNPSDRKKAIAGMKKLIKSTKPSVKVGSPEGKKFFKQLDLKYLSDDELADDFARSSNKNMTVKDLLQKHGKRLGIQFEQVEENDDINEKLDLVLTVKGDKNVALALNAMKKFKGISVKRQGKVKSGQVAVFGGDEKQLQKMQSSLSGKIRGLDMVSTHEAANPAQQAAIAIAKKEKEKKESIMDAYRQMHEAKEFKQSDIDTVAKLTDRNEHTKSLMHIAKVMGERKHLKKLELIYKMHNEYGHMPMNLKSLRDEIYDDLKKEMKKYKNGDDMYGAT